MLNLYHCCFHQPSESGNGLKECSSLIRGQIVNKEVNYAHSDFLIQVCRNNHPKLLCLLLLI